MLIELLRTRRSIRKFSEKPVDQESEEVLVEAMLRSPSSRSLNPWEFVVIRERETIARLAAAKPHGSQFIKEASLVIAFCADPERSDVWIEDTAISAIIVHLTAHDLGLGSCWTQIRGRQREDGSSSSDYVAEVLGLRPELEVEALIGIGYPAETRPGHDRSTLLYDRVSYENYGRTR